MLTEGVHFVIRLKRGSHPPIFLDKRGRRVDLTIRPGEEVIHRDLFYKGEVRVHVIGRWRRGFSEPLWVMTNLEPKKGLAIYLQRMKIGESFRDLKNLLNLEKVMNKSRQHMEQMVALVMIAYAIGLSIGEAIRDQLLRDQLYSEGVSRSEPLTADPFTQQSVVKEGKKWKLYSGLFILLKQKIRIPARVIRRIVAKVLEAFIRLVQHPVRTYV